MILYFSGTGNSEYAAKRLASQLDDDLLSINDRFREKSLRSVKSEKPLIFVLPTYAWRIPRLVEQWIRKVSFYGCRNAYFVMTCGDSIGNAGKYLRQLCSYKKFTYMGVRAVVMPENYIAMFRAPEEPEAIAAIMRADPILDEIAASIKRGIPLKEQKSSITGHLSSTVLNEFFYGFMIKDKKFFVTDDCIACGKCQQVCPLHNISIEDGIPRWHHRCTHCMACISSCPREAIEYGSATYGKRRYLCPEKSW